MIDYRVQKWNECKMYCPSARNERGKCTARVQGWNGCKMYCLLGVCGSGWSTHNCGLIGPSVLHLMDQCPLSTHVRNERRCGFLHFPLTPSLSHSLRYTVWRHAPHLGQLQWTPRGGQDVGGLRSRCQRQGQRGLWECVYHTYHHVWISLIHNLSTLHPVCITQVGETAIDCASNEAIKAALSETGLMP